MPSPERQQSAPRSINHAQALAGFFLIMNAWRVDQETARAILGTPSSSTYFAWRRGRPARLSHDTLQRIGYVAGIYKALQIVYSDAQQADTWVQRPNRAFGDQPPLRRMAAGDITDLAAVRAYLDAARAPWS